MILRIDKIEELRREIKNRTENREKIRARIDEYCERYYGIKDFSSIAEELFGEQQGFGVCLSRQIPTVSIQHLAKHLFARWLTENGVSAVPIALGFKADSFFFASDLKRSYCDIPYYEVFSATKRVVERCQVRKIIKGKERIELDGRILGNITTVVEGKTLVSFHQDLRGQVLGEDRLEIDLSDFFQECLKKCLDSESKEKPDYVFVENGNSKEKTVATENLNGHKILRPPAEWYYVLYLLLFLDGSRALLSADKHSKKSEALYEKAINAIEKAIGFSPLIISIPKEIKLGSGYKSNLLEVPKEIVANSYSDELPKRNWKDEFVLPNLGLKCGDYECETTLSEAYKFIAKQLLGERRDGGFG